MTIFEGDGNTRREGKKQRVGKGKKSGYGQIR
jgi:hypothetical protein